MAGRGRPARTLATWNPDRRPPAAVPTEPERETRYLLIDFFEKDRTLAASVDQLPWGLHQLRNWQRLFNLLGDLAFFDVAWRKDELEIYAAWSLVKSLGGLEPIEAYHSVLADPAKHSPYLRVLGILLLDLDIRLRRCPCNTFRLNIAANAVISTAFREA